MESPTGMMSHVTVTKPEVALVTGANGFMGTHMVKLLWQLGYNVVATDIGPTPAPVIAGMEGGIDYVQCDLRDSESVYECLRGRPLDYVFHVAGLFDYSAAYKDLYEVNVAATLNVLDNLRWFNRVEGHEGVKRVVMWAAAGVYDFAKESPAKETSPVNPKGGYLTTKYIAERQALEFGRRYGVPVTTIRPAGVYGPRSRYGVATSIFIAARGGMGPFFFGSKTAHAGTVHVQDVCRGALFLAGRKEAEGEIYNVGDDSSYTAEELMRTCAKRLGWPLIPGTLPLAIMRFFVNNMSAKAGKLGRISTLNSEMTDLLGVDSLLDTSKIKQLGWKPKYPDALAGLKSTIEWYEKEGWL